MSMSLMQMRAVRVLRDSGFSLQETQALIGEAPNVRDNFAAAALGAQIQYEGMEGCDPEHLAAMAYQVADAMMKERGGKK